jgi:amino acid permease
MYQMGTTILAKQQIIFFFIYMDLNINFFFSAGNLQSVVAHIITAVIGSGVLSLAWATAHLGWVGGPIALICCAIVTYISSYLLSDCYRNPDSVTGMRNHSYMDAVRVNLGNY